MDSALDLVSTLGKSTEIQPIVATVQTLDEIVSSMVTSANLVEEVNTYVSTGGNARVKSSQIRRIPCVFGFPCAREIFIFPCHYVCILGECQSPKNGPPSRAGLVGQLFSFAAASINSMISCRTSGGIFTSSAQIFSNSRSFSFVISAHLPDANSRTICTSSASLSFGTRPSIPTISRRA